MFGYTVIRELMDASRPAILLLLKWLYRRVQVPASQVAHQGADRVETKVKQRSVLCVLDTACIHQVWLVFITYGLYVLGMAYICGITK